MRKFRVSAILGCTLVISLFLTCKRAIAQPSPTSTVASPTAPLELKNGERVVFLGNSIFENDFQFGYLELALSTRWPDRDLTFRNLGWTGDNVYGVARSTITNPPTGYDLLMEHLTKARPTLVFLGYGGVEAQDGEAGLPTFIDGLTKLLDKIDQLGANAILLSPLPVLTTNLTPNVTDRNAMLQTYASAIAKLASARGKRYIDLFTPIQAIGQQTTLTDNGVHLNETGYYYLTTTLEKSLGLPPRFAPVTLSVGKNTDGSPGTAKLLTTNNGPALLSFMLDEPVLPLPRPTDDKGISNNGPILKVTGLKKGFYTLTADKETLVTASASDWANGIELRQGPWFEQVRELRQLILKKNDLFYFQYRPLNTTYILGFRSYEQGRHVKGLEEQSILIKWLEGQIALSRKPVASVYQLTPLK